MAVVAAARENARSDGYAQLKKIVIAHGLLKHGRDRFIEPILNTLGLAGIITGIVLLGHSWWSLFLALGAGFLFGQLGFMAHEATHNQVLKSSNRNYILSVLLFNFVLGGSRGWWAAKHNIHHAQPNRLGVDPDVEGGPIAVAPVQAREMTGFSKVFTRYQGSAIWPLMALSALQIHAQSADFLIRRKVRNVAVEISLLLAHYVLYVGGLIAFMGLGRALVFITAHQLVLGVYLGAAFLPNHVGMPVIETDQEMDFLQRQVLTSRNLRGNFLTDYLFGGLNRQIEHHLFPAMPRHSLRPTASIVRDFCLEHGISYHETGVFEAYVEVTRYLKRMTLSLRTV